MPLPKRVLSFEEVALPTAAHFKDRRGDRVGRLTVRKFAGVHNGNSHWFCQCECGNNVIVGSPGLNSARTRSCGCLRSEEVKTRHVTHGLTLNRQKDPAYNCWVLMRGRCYNPKSNRFALYGARGITVCDRWLVGEDGRPAFECFVADMGPRPSLAHSIDRIDPDRGYSPENCRWATPKEQSRNKRNTRRVVWRGQLMALADVCESTGAKYDRVVRRLSEGWDIERAVSTPKLGSARL